MPIVGHDGDHLQVTVRRLGRRRLLDKIGLDEGASTDCWWKMAITLHLTPKKAN